MNNFYTKDKIKLPYCRIGDFTYGEPLILRWDRDSILTIGKYCSISQNIIIHLGGNRRTNFITSYPLTTGKVAKRIGVKEINRNYILKGNVDIENDVWIGYGATILAGVKIENGAIIGAGSVVTKDVKPYQIVGGNPAKLIRLRFQEDQIKKLLEIKWWDWNEKKVIENAKILCFNNVDLFLKKFGGV